MRNMYLVILEEYGKVLIIIINILMRLTIFCDAFVSYINIVNTEQRACPQRPEYVSGAIL